MIPNLNNNMKGEKILYIFGLGGHAKVILSEIIGSKIFDKIIFVESNSYNKDNIVINNMSYEVINSLDHLHKLYTDNSYGIIGIGSILKRISIVKEINIKIPNFKWTKIISDNSTIAKDVTIGYGTVVISGSIINTGTKIGEHCIINTRATIDHDNQIRDFININPSVVTGGSVIIHDGSEIGIGSTVKNNILINKNVLIGGNSFVNKDCLPNSLYYGSPIKKIEPE